MTVTPHAFFTHPIYLLFFTAPVSAVPPFAPFYLFCIALYIASFDIHESLSFLLYRHRPFVQKRNKLLPFFLEKVLVNTSTPEVVKFS